MISINLTTITEIKATNDVIAQLNEYKSKNWAIGLNGDTLQPDGFLAFFTKRNLDFRYYVSSQGVSIGNPDAYDINIKKLQVYISKIKNIETHDVNATIEALELYKSKNWAIGLNGDTLQPDLFLPFFAERGISFAFYVRSQGISLGDQTAYDTNIKALKNYLSKL